MKEVILALGAESAGSFCVFQSSALNYREAEILFVSEDFGDLLEEKNFEKYKKAVLNFLAKNKIKPKIIITDLHPLYKTTIWGIELAKKFGAKHIQVQHHLAHIFSAVGHLATKLPSKFYGIAMDGTGYGLDGRIWGGEVFKFQVTSSELQVTHIGHLENQIMIGGDLAVREPARMLLAILAKVESKKLKVESVKKDFIYNFVKKFYTRNEFEVIYNQLQQNFNCQETSSAGRILDAVSVLLGFCKNERNYKHEPIDLLEKGSAGAKPYLNSPQPSLKREGEFYILQTTNIFEYLIKNIHKDKKRLAVTAQLYIAKGLYEIVKKSSAVSRQSSAIFAGGGIMNNKIISEYLENQGVILNKKISRGDAGISFGQIIYCLMTDCR